jgi:hypothetical protein
MVAGLNVKVPLLSVVMVTATVLPDGAVVGVVGAAVGVLPVVAVGVVPVVPVLPPPPQAARITMRVSAASPNQKLLSDLKARDE